MRSIVTVSNMMVRKDPSGKITLTKKTEEGLCKHQLQWFLETERVFSNGSETKAELIAHRKSQNAI